MAKQKFMHKIARYIQLLIFVSYLSHGFIPHHHHNDLASSYDIHLSQDIHVCVCHGASLESGEELHSDCLICDQLQNERQNHGLFFKEPVLAITVIFKNDFVIFPKENLTEDYPLINDFPLITDAVILNHGLRAPPIS